MNFQTYNDEYGNIIDTIIEVLWTLFLLFRWYEWLRPRPTTLSTTPLSTPTLKYQEAHNKLNKNSYPMHLVWDCHSWLVPL